jgi:hypothetical protein
VRNCASKFALRAPWNDDAAIGVPILASKRRARSTILVLLIQTPYLFEERGRGEGSLCPSLHWDIV